MKNARNNLPKPTPTVTPEIKSNFWKRVQKTEYCWIWIGSKLQSGYGRMQINKSAFKAHRISYEVNIGKIPNGMMVLHDCDNPACVRPDHLYAGTGFDNMRDMVERGRIRTAEQTARGEDLPNHRLTESSVREIRKKFDSGKHNMRQLCQEYRVCHTTIFNAVHRDTWKHVA